MLVWVLLTQLALAMTPVVAIGDELVVAAAEPGGVGTGGWVHSVADCLEESGQARWTVTDRSRTGETLRAAQQRVAEVRELAGPSGVLVVALGARELALGVVPAQLRTELDQLVQALLVEPAPMVILVDPIAPALAAGTPQERVAVDAAVSGFTRALGQVAEAEADVLHVRVWGDWPRAGRARRVLTERDRTLSARGHARVAAAVCDALVNLDAAEVEPRPAQ